MKQKIVVLITLCILAVFSQRCAEQAIPDPPAPILPIPSAKQLNWQKHEMLMFVHFGIKTFYPSDNHMGEGNEDPNRFNPKNFDARQWVSAA